MIEHTAEISVGRMNEERLRTFIENSTEAIWCIELERPLAVDLPEDEQIDHIYRNAYFSEANDAYAVVAGYEGGEQMKGLRLDDVMPRPMPESIVTLTRLIRSGYSITNLESVEKAKDGTLYYFIYNVFPIIEKGRILRMIGTVQDVTERRVIETALIQSKEFTSAVLNSIEDQIVVVDRNGVILAVNESWLRFARDNHADMTLVGSGVSYSDICRQASGKVATVNAQEAPAVLKGIDGVLKGSADHFEMEYPCHTPTQQRWFKMVALPFKGAKGGLVIAHRDITTRKLADIHIRRANEEISGLKKRLEKEWIYLQEEIKGDHNFDNIIGRSDALKYVLHRVAEVAPTDAPVLVMGETGTGKELIARAIHHASLRSKRALVKINCAALPATLIENELFGHEKGAFTNADTRRVGRFQLAHGATLFLDEISEIPIDLQAKLLRVLQDGEYEPLGSSQTKRADVRIIAASNRNLEDEVKNGRFRKDLLYRINVFPLTIPPLRDRKEDIPLLVNRFVKKYNREMGKAISSIPAGLIRHLQAYDWPGNIRELENVIERAVITSKDAVLRLSDKLALSRPLIAWGGGSLKLADVERAHISLILEKTHWKIEGDQGAAQLLGLAPSTLRDRLKKLGIRRSGIGS